MRSGRGRKQKAWPLTAKEPSSLTSPGCESTGRVGTFEESLAATPTQGTIVLPVLCAAMAAWIARGPPSALLMSHFSSVGAAPSSRGKFEALSRSTIVRVWACSLIYLARRRSLRKCQKETVNQNRRTYSQVLNRMSTGTKRTRYPMEWHAQWMFLQARKC